MIWRIVRKELLENLLSLRFALGLAVVLAMMGIVGYVLLGDYVSRWQTYIADVQRHREELEEVKVYSTIEVTVDFPPSPLSIFSRGARDLPTSIGVSPYRVPSLMEGGTGGSAVSIHIWGTSKRPENPFLRIFNAIDLSFVVRVIFSLFAVLLVFDSFSGEREQGTLSMIMSCPVGRLEVLAGKFIGACTTMAIPLALGFLMVLILWSVSPEVEINAKTWKGGGLLFLSSLLYLAGFIALGLLVSLCVHDSSAGLMYLLLIWVVVAVVLPEGGGYLAHYARPQDSRQQILEAAENAWEEYSGEYEKIRDQHPQKSGWWGASTDDTGADRFIGISLEEMENRVAFNKKAYPMKFRYAEKKARIFERYEGELRRWRQLRGHLLRASFCNLYGNIVQSIAGTGMETYELALDGARHYRKDLVAFLLPKVGLPELVTRVHHYPDTQVNEENRRYWDELDAEKGKGYVQENIMNWDRMAPLDLSALPLPRIVYPELGARMAQARLDILLLVAFAVLPLGLAGWRVLHYRVR